MRRAPSLLALGPTLALAACVGGPGARTPPTLDEVEAADGEAADDADGDGNGDGDGVAVISDGAIDPDPDQLAAGVPYLRFDVDIGSSPTRGPADAPVTIVMFSDFECPYCVDAFATVRALEAEFPDTIRFVGPDEYRAKRDASAAIYAKHA